jgi:hypothetical protein
MSAALTDVCSELREHFEDAPLCRRMAQIQMPNGSEMSVYWGRPEVIGAQSERRD